MIDIDIKDCLIEFNVTSQHLIMTWFHFMKKSRSKEPTTM
jgi:hypothetical protein